MHKSNKKTNLAKLYNDLNNDSKKLLLDYFRREFSLKTDARLYKLLGKPHLLTALEAHFLAKAFKCGWNEILEKQIIMRPIAQLLAEQRLSEPKTINDEETKKNTGTGA